MPPLARRLLRVAGSGWFAVLILTMYAFASLGEIEKRDLNAGDVAGINGLY